MSDSKEIEEKLLPCPTGDELLCVAARLDNLRSSLRSEGRSYVDVVDHLNIACEAVLQATAAMLLVEAQRRAQWRLPGDPEPKKTT